MPNDGDVLVAYFSMEFGVDARLAIYSGGLGVLAGDHLKAAAELGVPLVAVGLFYRGGYFVQGVSDEGRQTERYAGARPRGARARPRARRGRGRSRRRGRQRRRLALRHRLGAALPARRAVGDRRAVLRQPRAPDPAGAPARRRRRARAARARDHAERVPRQRGPLGVPRDRARPRARRGRRVDRRRARRDSPLDGLHDAHAGAGRATRCSATTSCSATSATSRAARGSPTTACSISAAAPTPTGSG